MQHNKVGEQNLFRLFGRFNFILIFSALISLLSAGSFEDFKKNQSTAFANYKEENDRTFLDFLKSDWEAYLLKEPNSAYEEKKPRELYPARSIVVKKQGPKVNIKIKNKKVLALITY